MAEHFSIRSPNDPKHAAGYIDTLNQAFATSLLQPAAPLNGYTKPITSPPLPDAPTSALQGWVVESAATSQVKHVLPAPTPLMYTNAFSEDVGNAVYLKREDCTPVFSFKVRGAYNKLSHVPKDLLAKGVSCCSAGNHAQGVAYCAKLLGVSAKIYMPCSAPRIKVSNVKRFGAEVYLTGETLEDCYKACMEENVKEGRVFVHPFDDPYVIAGNGTVSLELMHQIDLGKVDYIFIPCGGGGLAAGISSVLKSVAPNIKVVVVEAAEAAGMKVSVENGVVTALDRVGRFADGASIKRVGDYTFKLCKSLVDEVIVVNTREICKAIADAFAEVRVVLEPAGALAIAGCRKYIETNNLKGNVCIVVTTGANVDFSTLRYISEEADNNERVLSILLPEFPGSFKKMFKLLIDSEITSISYHQSHRKEGEVSNVTLTFRISVANPENKVIDALEANGYHPLELHDSAMATFHGKYLNCGRDGLEENECIYRFEFQNKKIMLPRFIDLLKDDWNVTLIHYRNYGADTCSFLLGIDKNTPFWSNEGFSKFLAEASENGYRYEEVGSDAFVRRLLPQL